MGSINYGNYLPFEIWRECFLLLDPRDHRNLWRTCRLFYDICLPFIFKSMTYSSTIRYKKGCVPKDMESQLLKFNANLYGLNAISSDVRLAPLIRILNLRYSLRLYKHSEEALVKAAKDAYHPFVRTFVEAVSNFVNLRQVNVDFQRNMDKAILAALAFLPRLEVIAFTRVRFSAHTLKPRLKLKSLIINNTKLKPGEIDPNPNSSAKLLDVFSTERLEDIQSYSWSYSPKLLRALTKQGTSLHLVTLDLQLRAGDFDVLYPFLMTCPNVRHLGIDINDWRSPRLPPLPPLPQSALPRLRVLRCPCGVAKAIVPGRPIIELSLTHRSGCTAHNSLDIVQDVIPAVSQTTGHLTTLDIDTMVPNPKSFDLIARAFPKLQKLSLGLDYRPVAKSDDSYITELSNVVPKDQLLRAMHQADATAFNGRVVPADYHAIYLNLIHLVALKKIDIPLALKVLELTTDQVSLPGQGPYTIRNILTILNAMSYSYPEILHIEVAVRGFRKFKWCKDEDGAWALIL